MKSQPLLLAVLSLFFFNACATIDRGHEESPTEAYFH